MGGGPKLVVSTVAFQARVRGSFSCLGAFKENTIVSFSSTHKTHYSVSSPVSEGQCHLTHLTILRRFSWPNLACMCTKVADLFHFVHLVNIAC